MNNLSYELDETLQDTFQQKRLEELEQLEMEENKPVDTRITELMADYATLKLIQIRLEHEKELQQLHYDTRHTIIKKDYMQDGLKSTEAKEQANNDLIQEKQQILTTEKQISLTKANIDYIKYQLRLKFYQMRLEISINEVDME